MQSALRWLHQTRMTEPAVHEAQIRAFPSDVTSLGRIVQGLLVHSEWRQAHGVDPSSTLTVSWETLPVCERLDRLAYGGKPRLDEPRTPGLREPGTCRDFALILCSFLRVHGVPARLRCGFASYFSVGWEDHWVGEYWDAGTAAWLLADAQLDDVMSEKLAVAFDPFNMPRDVFLTAGEAWSLCRSGRADPANFGHGSTKGLWFMGVNVVRDNLTLNGRETSPWDRWREAADDQRMLAADELHELDRMAQSPETAFCELIPPWLSPFSAGAFPAS